MAKGTVMEMAHELDYLVRARYPLIAVQTYEEQRVLNVVKKIAFSRRKEVFVWNCHRGLWQVREEGTEEQINDSTGKTPKQPQAILEHIANHETDSLFVLQDLQMFLGKNPVVDRQVKDVVTGLQVTRKTIVVTGTAIEVPSDLDKYMTLLDFPMPDREVLTEAITSVIDEMNEMDQVTVDLSEENQERLIEASRGLTVAETKLAASKAVVSTGRLDENSIKIVTAEKRQIIRKSGILEYYPADTQMNEVGGLDLLKGYINERQNWWSHEAQEFGLSYLNGIVLIGIPGTGKSLIAKTMASYWGLPLIRLDMSRIFDKFVGGSEENIRKATQTAEAVAPAILWLDEVEKAMATGSGDNGTSRRVLGQFLTWMQEKSEPIYVVCTANKVEGAGGLPPEFLRKGRFDDLFWVSLPSQEELKEIINIHLVKKGRELSEAEIVEVAKQADGYSGAEIEAAVENGLWKCYGEKIPLTKDLLIESLKETKPLSSTMSEAISESKEWAKGRVRYASSAADTTVKAEQNKTLNVEV